MRNKALFLLGLICLFAVESNGQEQVANFTSGVTKGCSPITVSFNNTSTPATGLTYFWDFGNGTTSEAKNPVVLFTEPGTYTIKLTISDGTNSNTVTKQNYITVFKKPIPEFSTSFNKIGCAPYQIAFQNQTQLGDTSMSVWHWDFGDGFISGQENPVHTFQYQDTYSISLYVKDKNNCENLIVHDNYISAFKPISSFVCSDSVSCNGLLNTSFINSSSGIGELNYLWNFGNDSVSTIKNPQMTYNQQGLYGVSLITIDEHSCSDTVLKAGLIVVEEIVPGFSTTKDTVCINENIAFTNTSNSTSKCRWDFGDGTFSESVNPNHSYSTHGDYEIVLTITVDKGCSSSYKSRINVENIVANYTSSQKFSCANTVIVNYTDNSTNATKWDWRFGNKIKSSLKNPTNTYTIEGIYIDTLIVTSRHGCKSTKVVNPGLTIVRPVASFTPNNWVEVNSLKGCTPLTVNFVDKSFYTTNQDTIKSWFWDFGDGTTSNSKNPAHVFRGTDSYQVSLMITTAKGCVSYNSATAKTGTKQNADFIKDGPNTICASTQVQFTDKSENKSLVNEWFWRFGDGTTSNKQNPLHIFADTGYMEVKLNVYYNGCPDDEIKKKFIYIKGPIVKPDYTTNCTDPLIASLKSNKISADKIYWDFGDGSAIDSIQLNPNHPYSSRGDYKVMVRAINNSNGCSYEAEKNVSIKDIKAVIDMDKAVGCPGATITFNPINSIDHYNFLNNGVIAKYLWDFDDGTKVFNSISPFSHQFNSKGTYNIKLKVKDFRGCEDSVIQQIKIYKPEPAYLADNFVGCMPMSVDFENQTKSDTTIAQWFWEFGDNTTSTEKDPVHIYTKHGLYNVSLTATDGLGCSTKRSTANYIEAVKPSPDFTVSDRTVCTGDTLLFKCQATDSIKNYLWDFGDGTNSSLPNPIHSYSNTGAYNISLKLTDVQGCDSTRILTNFIDLQEAPIVNFAASETFTNCFPLVVYFTDNSEGININKWDWSFDENQSSSQIQNPIHTYTKPGIYDVGLKATTSYGCSNSLLKNNLIEVRGPWVNINAPQNICKNVPVKLIAEDKSEVYDMLWFYGDGTVGTGDTVYHSYQNPGTLTPALLVISDDLHTCDKYFVDTMIMDVLESSIYEIENGQMGCVPFNKSFTDRSVGAISWMWDFGEGNTSSNQNPVHNYNHDGQFRVKLAVSNSYGCTDTSYSNIVVFPLPDVKLTNDTLICKGQSIQLQASGALSYTWFPVQFLNSDDISNPVSTPEQTIRYEVLGTDFNGCVNYSNLNLAVQQVPEITIPDTTIIIGEIVEMDAYATDLSSYNWSPSYALDNTNNPIVYAQPLESTIYELTVRDTNQCFVVTKQISIGIRKEYTVDVPSAFTPNGDGNNDKIFVKGWGVKDVISFKIYNRFGELVFESHDKNSGWDGMHKGNNQNIETYTYDVTIRTYEDEIMEKTGTIKLLK